VEGTGFHLDVTTSNLTLPFSYSYSGLPPGCDSANVSALLCVPTGTGSFTVQVTVQSPYGGSAVASLPLTVASRPGTSNPHPSGSSSPVPLLGWLGIAGAVLTAALIVLLLVRRRPSNPRPEAPPPEEPEHDAAPEAPPEPASSPPEPPPTPEETPAPPPTPPAPSAPEALDELEAELDRIADELGHSDPESADPGPE
jgi:hypothetical protein